MNPLKFKTADLRTMKAEEIFKISGALLEGHTEFYNGKHGNGWIEKGFIIRHPNLLEELSRRQAEQIKKFYPNTNFIVGTAYNGTVVASYVARHLNTLFAHTYGKGQDISFHRMFKPPKGLNLCFVEDLIFSGTDVSDHINFFKNYSLNIQGVSVWVNRQKDIIQETKITSLINTPFRFYEKETCPLCQKKVPIRYLNSRE